jgi:hypothetical protein
MRRAAADYQNILKHSFSASLFVEEPQKGRWNWQVKAAVIAVLVYLGIALSLYMKLKQLPGPYYGGDLYSHHGFALNYIANGFWSDPYFVGHYAFYPWLGNYVFIALSLLPGVTMLKAEIFVGLITTTLSAIAYYFLGKQLFKSDTWALVLMLFSLVSRGIPDGAPNLLPWMITIPFWFGFWLKAEETSRMRDKLLAGLFMGCTALAHVAFFLAGMAIFAFTIVVNTLLQKDKKTAIASAFKTYVPMLAAGFVVSLLFYGPIIVNYHAKTLNPLFQYNGPDIGNLGLGWVLKTVFNSTLNFSSLVSSVLTLLSLLGLVVCVLNFNKKEPRYAVLWYIAGFLAPMHHLITRPLLGKWVLPSHLFGISLALLVFSVYGARTVAQFAEKKWPNSNARKMVLAGILVLVVVLFMQRYGEYRANRWVQFGEQFDPTTQAWFSIGKWIQQNTGINDVFLTNDESCFAMNGFTGRKCVLVRRTHANYFVDVEQRYADGIVMLYGNNSTLTKKLIGDYDAKYVLVDGYMQQYPVFVDAIFEQYLADNNVTFQKIRERKDISVPDSKVFDLLAVPFQPFNKELESKMSIATSANINDMPAILVYKVSR